MSLLDQLMWNLPLGQSVKQGVPLGQSVKRDPLVDYLANFSLEGPKVEAKIETKPKRSAKPKGEAKAKKAPKVKNAPKKEAKPKVKKEATKAPKRKKISLTLRTTVWNKYIGAKLGSLSCPYCMTNQISQLSYEAGHVISHADGGDLSPENLRPICGPCNKSMGKTILDVNKWNIGFGDSMRKLNGL